jgi:pseudomonalisin
LLLSKSTAVLGAGALAVTGALAAASQGATAHPATWTATHTQALKLNARSLGAAPQAQSLDISVALPLRNKAALDRVVQQQATPGSRARLTAAQVNSEFGPTAATIGAVEGYLSSEGFTSVVAEPNGLLVDATGTVGEVERAFDTSIGLFSLNGQTVYANTAGASVPSSLAGDVVAVLGLSDIPMQLPLQVRTAASVTHPAAAAGSPDLSGFSPQAIQHAYQADTLPPANGSTVGIIASGDMTSTISDLRYADAAWKLPQVQVNVAYAGPKSAIIENNPLTGNLEWDLDTQISTGVAQTVKSLTIFDVATFTDSEVARGINMFAGQDDVQSLSASLGECEFLAFLDGAMITTDESLEEAAAQGQSMFASTGDNGFACPEVASTGAPGGPPDVSWPADGEWTTGVGGTTLLADDKGNVSQEVAWIGGGGGISPFEAAGPWTLQANGAGQTWEFTNQGGRSVPDVAADADPNTGVTVYDGKNSSTVVGGTSVSSPLVMGLWARIDSADGGQLTGDASLGFYRLYNAANPATTVNGPLGPVYVPAANPTSVSGFRDVVLGTNGAYTAKPGYDYTTGIGTLQAATLAKLLR